MENLPFSKFFENVIKFLEKIWAKFIKFYNMQFLAFGGRAPLQACEFIKNLLEKSLEILRICINYERIFLIKMRILIKINVRLMASWNL